MLLSWRPVIIIKVGENLTKFGQKNNLAVFSRHGVLYTCLRKKLCQCYYLNNSVKDWSISIIFGMHATSRRNVTQMTAVLPTLPLYCCYQSDNSYLQGQPRLQCEFIEHIIDEKCNWKIVFYSCWRVYLNCGPGVAAVVPPWLTRFRQ